MKKKKIKISGLESNIQKKYFNDFHQGGLKTMSFTLKLGSFRKTKKMIFQNSFIDSRVLFER